MNRPYLDLEIVCSGNFQFNICVGLHFYHLFGEKLLLIIVSYLRPPNLTYSIPAIIFSNEHDGPERQKIFWMSIA